MDVSNRYLLQNIFRAYEMAIDKKPLAPYQRKAVDAIAACRSGALGTSYYQCAERHAVLEQHHSCRHRSCYVCSLRSRQRWVEAQKRRLLDCPHFHLVFTLPSEYRVLWQYNTAWFAQTLFSCVQETVLSLMSDDRHQGVTPGLLCALHTWGRQLNLHPHIHCLVTAGGLDDGGCWKHSGDYLLPVKVLKALYRGKLQARLKVAFEAGSLRFPPDMDEERFWRSYRQAYKKAWSVRIEEQYRHGKGVILYLSRYMKGGPVHPGQIRRCDADAIGFIYKDHRDQRRKCKTLKPMDFLKKLLLHVPPRGVHTVRHYGLYASACRNKRNACREQMGDLSAYETSTGVADEAVVTLNCRDCGAPMKRRYWTGRQQFRKGNSIIKYGAGRFAQQVDETVVANELRIRGPCHGTR